MPFSMRYLANWLTGSRILFALVIYPLLVGSSSQPKWLIPVFVFYILGEMTDLLDGDVARRTNAVSAFGAILDPLADSIFRFLLLLGMARLGWVPFWLVPVFFLRDIFVAYARCLAAAKGMTVAARRSGKIKAIVQFVFIFFLLGAGLIQMAPMIRAAPGVGTWTWTAIGLGSTALLAGLIFLQVSGWYLALILAFAAYSIVFLAALATPSVHLPRVDLHAGIFLLLAGLTACTTVWSGIDYLAAFLPNSRKPR